MSMHIEEDGGVYVMRAYGEPFRPVFREENVSVAGKAGKAS